MHFAYYIPGNEDVQYRNLVLDILLRRGKMGKTLGTWYTVTRNFEKTEVKSYDGYHARCDDFYRLGAYFRHCYRCIKIKKEEESIAGEIK